MGFVRYDDLDTDYGPDFEDDLATVVAEVERTVHGSVEAEGEGRAVRFAHAKAYGLLRAEVQVLPPADPAYAQGLFASPGHYPAVIRYSNGLGHVRPDARLGTACGMAIKMFDIPGPSLTDEPAAGTMDYNLINNPVFFANTARDYVVLARLFSQLPDALADRSQRVAWLHAFVTRDGELPPEKWLWDELLAILSQQARPLPHLLHTTFWSMGAVRHGEYVAKVRVAPATGTPAAPARPVDPLSSAHPVRAALLEDVASADHVFDLQVQLCTDLTAMPVENTSVPWPEHLSPFVTVARIIIPAQDVSAPDNLDRADVPSFTPWRTPEEHRPVGQIQEVRRRVYERSSVLRHRLNGQVRVEPRDQDDVLPPAP
ncbi:catalase family protein [Streptomyces sp. NBC_01264]|uniref:catalase family protein n=1 Tax=Streptomyces sp. NBC_01264 TaxID=2903804 RepID=UPI00224E0E6F|nr:catalase family protein [Streptomyces sp. NBC_01264]MCX4784368.1 catalase family protein [Streptomyces sp. NBC_01264]